MHRSPVIAVALALAAGGPALAAPAEVTVTPITKATVNSFGQAIVFPQGPGQISASMYNIPPGRELPVHKHPAPRIGYVLAGTLKVTNEETGQTRVFTAGQVLLESVDQWHKGANVGRDPVRLLVIDLQPRGAGDPTVRKR